MHCYRLEGTHAALCTICNFVGCHDVAQLKITILTSLSGTGTSEADILGVSGLSATASCGSCVCDETSSVFSVGRQDSEFVTSVS